MQVGAKWADFFSTLELHHGLDINNVFHIWLLHHLFLPDINQELAFFIESWNQHKITIRGGPSRSPADMFGFDMLVNGVRGDALASLDPMDGEELEVYGVDWEALHDDGLRANHASNNTHTEGWSSWIGQAGPPPPAHLNEVNVEAPELEEEERLSAVLQPLVAAAGRIDTVADVQSLLNRWATGLAITTAYYMHY